MPADPTPPLPATAVAATHDETAARGLVPALVTAVADGARHDYVDLASHLVGRSDPAAVADVRGALDLLVDSGMPLATDATGVVARAFVPLDGRAMGAALPDWRVDVVGATASTNGDLLRAARHGLLAGPRLLAAEWQTAGRGRFGRRWSAAPGMSLTVSFAVVVRRRLAALDGATLVCGLAVLDAVRARDVAAALKWPNDVVVGDRKLGGILVEAHANGDATTVVVGVGLNVAPPASQGAPDHQALERTDLATCGARALDRNALVVDVATALQRRLERFGAAGFIAFADEWNAADGWRDRAVTLRATGGATDERRGVARGVDSGGALRLDVDGRVERIISGDLSLRAADPLLDVR